MSGKRQHYIPRFLQEGFARDGAAEQKYVWVYRKGMAPFKTNTVNVGVESYFYADGADNEADEFITKAEGMLGAIVDELRRCTPGRLSNEQLPTLIGHLEVRTRHLRQNVLQVGGALISTLMNAVAQDGKLVDRLVQRQTPQILLASLEADLRKRNMPAEKLDAALKVAALMLPILMPRVRAELAAFARAITDQLPTILESAAKKGQLKILKQTIAPEPRVQRYAVLQYDLLETLGADHIQGDSALVFSIEGARRYKAFLDKDDIITAIYLPLTPERLLVASPQGFSGTLPADLREAVAQCSLDYFIASESTEPNIRLQDRIGESSALLSASEMDDLISDLLENH